MIELYLSWGAHVFDLPQHCRVASAIKAFIETHGHVFFVVEKALALAPTNMLGIQICDILSYLRLLLYRRGRFGLLNHG